MSKWADYCILKAKFNTDGKLVDELVVRADNGNLLDISCHWVRRAVVSKIERGWTFATIHKNGDGKWEKGHDVRLIRANGGVFLRTDNQAIESDSLSDIPCV